MESCIYINGEFINLYTKDNPILESGDTCYCLIFNNDDYHRPLIAKSLVIEDKFVDGLNKQYVLRILEFNESPIVIKQFFIGKSVTICPYYNETVHSKKVIKVTNHFDYNYNLFRVEAYFVRKSLQEIIKLRNEYINVVHNDIQRMLSDINSI